jgi:hypothetical protein
MSPVQVGGLAGIHAVHYQDNAHAIREIEKLLTTP